MVVTKGDIIGLDEFVHLYHLRSLRSTGIMNSCPGSGRLGSSLIFHCPSDIGSQGSFLYLGMDGKLSLMIFRVKFLGCFVVGGP